MIMVFIIIFLLCLYEAKVSYKEGFADYMSPQASGSIKGIFVLIVLFSHMRQYVTFDRSYAINEAYYWMMSQIGQLMVVAFLFYSGYGIMQAIEKKKINYVRTMPKRRILKTYFHFAVTILIYLILNYCLGVTFPIKRILLSLLAWSAVGNSAWFMFAIFIIYIITYLVFMVAKDNMKAGVAAVTVALIVYIIIMWQVVGDKNAWYYDTVLCYPLGMLYSLLKPKIDSKLLPSFKKWISALLISTFIFLALHQVFKADYAFSRLAFIFEAMAFAIVIAILSMRVCINNGILRWCGSRVFSVYMLQRVPMIILAYFGLDKFPYIFVWISVVATLVIAELFDRIMEKTDKLLKL